MLWKKPFAAGDLLQGLSRIAMFVAVALLLSPSVVGGELNQYIPHLYNFHTVLEVDGFHFSDRNTTNGTGLTVSSSSIQEKLTLSTEGYVYHPNLMQLMLSVSPFLEQDRNSGGQATEGKTQWREATGLDYAADVKILPYHPYNLELFSSSNTSYAPGGIVSNKTVSNQNGAMFTYTGNPFFANASYAAIDSKSNGIDNNSQSFIVYGGHNVPFSQTALNYSHITTETDVALTPAFSRTDTTKDNYQFSNTLSYKGLSLSSNVNYNLNEQKTTPLSNTSNQKLLSWNEIENWRLPWNFYSGLTYTHNSISQEFAQTSSNFSSSSTSDNVGFTLGHQLYENLSTNYSLSWSKSHSSDQSTDTTRMQTLTVNYIRTIPIGGMNLGLLLGEIDENRNGPLIILTESHSAKLLAPDNQFALNQTSADISSLVVKVRIPGTEVDYELPKTFYFTSMKGPFPAVTIIDLPAAAPPVKQTDPNFSYNFTVSYNLLPDTVKLRTTLTGYSAQFNLFNNLLNPYYRYSSNHQEVVSGTLTGGANSTVITSVGIILNKGPIKWLNDYTNNDSTIAPTKQYLSQFDYMQEIFKNTYLNAGLRYVRIRYLTGEMDTVPRNYSEVDKSITLGLSKTIPLYHLIATAGGSYGTSHSLTNSKIYTANGELRWKMGRMDLVAGASLSNFETVYSGGASLLSTTVTKTSHEYYYLRMKRVIF